ncbi:MAG: TIGR03915 family putative DNA repair protein [Elusimicrobiota bacterium]|jgi:probable DNA metabolism protein|nr:TIGR03915 family putative DNA repair protein [Elusimicrobiota bacterium]
MDDLIYTYDGSFYGFLTCVFESFKHKTTPLSISRQPLLLASLHIKTDAAKAKRVLTWLKSFDREILNFIENSFLSCAEGKEYHLLAFIKLLHVHGTKALTFLHDENVLFLRNAVKNLINEVCQYKGFVRFEKINQTFFAKINPKNMVLAHLAWHFADRLNNESFMIYDETHKMICIYKNKKCEIFNVEDFEVVEADETEKFYKALWKKFYDISEIKGRTNSKLRQQNMPKRFWKNLTEMQ